MGIHGLLKEIGHGQRISLAKLSAEYYIANDRPFRLAIDISIWLFQIQSGKGGSNPALRTFYYRLLRLLSLNIHPLFVFDGPNKPLFKRNKKVGGPGVRVASVPEFLAKQLLKQFGFPWHVAPGEAEAECALLQRESIVDAVLSEDVDTLMFGSGVTLRNWTAENSTKTPTHVDVHRSEETKTRSGMDREGMILVALMSGGDYLPEGIPGCGPKVACDAARAGFGKDLCALRKSDATGLTAWKDRILHEIRTNESKFFTKRNPKFSIPENFPNREVLGFYTHPCVSASDKLLRLKQELQWDQSIDFAALRTFTADAFDWRCLGGAKKFIKNLAPALLVRELRLSGKLSTQLGLEAREEEERQLAQAIHGKRNHSTTDGELEYRISLIPAILVPIDLSIEDEDDDFVPAGGATEDGSDVESEFMPRPPSTQGDNDSDVPASPKKRNSKPYDPAQPEKLWILRPFLLIGCPLLVEEYEASFKDPREFLKQRNQAKTAAQSSSNVHVTKSKSKKSKATEPDMPANALMAYAQVSKATSRPHLMELSPKANARSNPQPKGRSTNDDDDFTTVARFKMPSTQIPASLQQAAKTSHARVWKTVEVLDLATSSPVQVSDPIVQTLRTALPVTSSAPVGVTAPASAIATKTRLTNAQRTPKRGNKRRPSPDLSSPALSQKTITSFYSPSPRKIRDVGTLFEGPVDVIDLISSPATGARAFDQHWRTFDRLPRPLSPTPPNARHQFIRTSISPPPVQPDFSPGKLSDNVTKRRKKSPLKRWQTEPAILHGGEVNVLDISPSKSDEDLASPSTFVQVHVRSNDIRRGSFRDDEDMEQTPRPTDSTRTTYALALNDGLTCHEDLRSTCLIPTTITEEGDDDLPPMPVLTRPKSSSQELGKAPRRPAIKSRPTSQPLATTLPHGRSPLQQARKKRILLRESLEGSWKEVEAEAVDMTGDGSGWKQSGGKAAISGWRKSGVEVLDLTGA